jgi:isoleucyl-tRNA synthetase
MGLISKRYRFFCWKNQSRKQWNLRVVIAGKSITLTIEDVEISSQDIEGWLVANSNGITVALDMLSQN